MLTILLLALLLNERIYYKMTKKMITPSSIS